MSALELPQMKGICFTDLINRNDDGDDNGGGDTDGGGGLLERWQLVSNISFLYLLVEI